MGNILHSAETNNIIKARQSRFQGVVARHHPTMSVFRVILKEQTDTEIDDRSIETWTEIKKTIGSKTSVKRMAILSDCHCLQHLSATRQQHVLLEDWRALRAIKGWMNCVHRCK